MILPDFILPSRINLACSYIGVDRLEKCLNRRHFLEYPYKINYSYNSRGFRDAEWPEQVHELQSAIWCVGDSFTVGLGSPYEHIWPQRLQHARNQRTINVSMDGASNNWIARKTCGILETISPQTIIIQWSYISRREAGVDSVLDQEWNDFYNRIREPDWPNCNRHQWSQLNKSILLKINNVYGGWNEDRMPRDEDRLLHFINCSTQDDINNTLDCIRRVQAQAGNTVIIHSFIPKFVPDNFKGTIESQIVGLVIPELGRLDIARDGHHYDVLTSDSFVAQIQQLLT